MRVLFFVEGFTDIRFLVGLSEICDLTVAVPSRAYRSSGLVDRVAASGARFHVDEIAGGRAAYQLRSLRYLWQRAGEFDVVLAQEMLRGALNATVVGAAEGRAGGDLHGHLADRVLPVPAGAGPDRCAGGARRRAGHPDADARPTARWRAARW